MTGALASLWKDRNDHAKVPGRGWGGCRVWGWQSVPRRTEGGEFTESPVVRLAQKPSD
jgi:hypothetical protein